MKVQQKTKGFTIIEVVLVLAIAALIFLLVFLALPALQRSQRDTQRRSDVGRVIASIQTFQSNTNGNTPFTPSPFKTDRDFVSSYLTAGGSSFQDPSFGSYTFVGSSDVATAKTLVTNTSGNATWLSGKIAVVIGGTCADTSNPTGGTSKDAVIIGLEGGGAYCANN